MPTESTRRSFVKLLLGSTAAALLAPRRSRASGASPDDAVRHSTFVMGQVATITAYGAPAPVLREAITGAFGVLRRVDALMSVFSSASDIGRINAAAGREDVTVDPWTGDAIRAAVEHASRSRGLYDPTVEPLMRVWGFRDPRSTRPGDRELRAALDAVGSKHLVMANGRIGLDAAGAAVDLGGIGVGFAIDRAVERLKSHGVPCALIDVSGDLFAIGAPPDSDGWVVGITDPLQPDSVITSRTIRDEALCTSGNYRNIVVYDAITFGHVMDPRSGEPAQALASATVIAPTATTADAFSKPAFVDAKFAFDGGRIVRVRNDGEVF